MAIRGNIGLNVVPILATDTVLINTGILPGFPERIAITAASLHNTTAGSIVVQVYVSPDLTTASGKRVDSVTLATNETMDIPGIISQGLDSVLNIIAIADLIGCNASLTIVEYTAGS